MGTDFPPCFKWVTGARVLRSWLWLQVITSGKESKVLGTIASASRVAFLAEACPRSCFATSCLIYYSDFYLFNCSRHSYFYSVWRFCNFVSVSLGCYLSSLLSLSILWFSKSWQSLFLAGLLVATPWCTLKIGKRSHLAQIYIASGRY